MSRTVSPTLMSASARSEHLNVDPESPWPGLASYNESALRYFFGRDKEILDLKDRLSGKPLTVLYGQSGLGKTSLLRAGLIPQLESVLPVYIHLRFDESNPSLEQQVKLAILERAQLSGLRIDLQADPLDEDTDLWQIFHDPAFGFVRADGTAVVKIALIFDQFEELGTLGSFKRPEESQQFMQTLASVVENRPPLDVQVRMEADEDYADRIVSSIQIAHTLLSLRNDYLHWLERYRSIMPSMMDCRLELRPLTGAQALMAVVQPGKIRCQQNLNPLPIVDETTGRAIVSYVSGISRAKPLSEAQATPPILNLLCRQLNAQRLKAGVDQITLESVESNAGDVLRSFLTETFSGKPELVRSMVEDKLVTHDGCRDFVVRASFEKDLHNAGVSNAGKIVEDLVSSRLLTLEDRDGVARVELTHDVLLPFVLEHRTVRHRNEDLVRRKIEEASRRTAAAKRFAVGSLVIGLAASCLFAMIAWREANRAKSEAVRADDLSLKSKERLREFANVHLKAGDRAWQEYLRFTGDSTIAPGHTKWHEAVAQWGRSLELFADTGESDPAPMGRLAAISADTRLAAVPAHDSSIHSDGFLLTTQRKYILSLEKDRIVCRAVDHIEQVVWSVPLGFEGDQVDLAEANEAGDRFFVIDIDHHLRTYSGGQNQDVPPFKEFQFDQNEHQIRLACWLDNSNLLVQFENKTAVIWDINADRLGDEFSCVMPVRPYHVTDDHQQFLCISDDNGSMTLCKRIVKTGKVDKVLLTYSETSEVIQDVAPHPTKAMTIVASRPANSSKIESRFTIVETGNSPNQSFRPLLSATIPATIDGIIISDDGRWMMASVDTMAPSPCEKDSSHASEGCAACGGVIGEHSRPGFSTYDAAPAAPAPAPDAPSAAPAAPAPGPAAARLDRFDLDTNQVAQSRIRLVSHNAPTTGMLPNDKSDKATSEQADGAVQPTASAGYIFLFDLRNENEVLARPLRLEGPIMNLSWGRNDFLYTLDAAGSLKVWDLRSAQELITAATAGHFNSLIPGNDDQHIVVDNQGNAHLLQPPTPSQNWSIVSIQDGQITELRASDATSGQQFYAAVQKPDSIEIHLLGATDSSIVQSLANARFLPVIASSAEYNARFGIEQRIGESQFKSVVWKPDAPIRELSRSASSLVWLKNGREVSLPVGDLSGSLGTKDGMQLFPYSTSENVSSSDNQSIVLSTETEKEFTVTVFHPETKTRTQGNQEIAYTVSVPHQETRTAIVRIPVLFNIEAPDKILRLDGFEFLGFARTSNLMAVANETDRTMELWDLKKLDNNNDKIVAKRKVDQPVTSANFSMKDRRILVTSMDPIVENTRQTYTISVWDLDNRLSADITRSKLEYATISPSGRWLLTVDPRRIVNLIDLDSDQSNMIPIQLPQRAISALFSKDEREIIIATERAVIRWRPTNLYEPIQQADEAKAKQLIQYAQAVSGLSFDKATGELTVSEERPSASQWQELLKQQ